jgi:hypothetical protein
MEENSVGIQCQWKTNLFLTQLQMRKTKVLFVSNVSVWGGSVKSLYQTISTIKNDSNFEPYLMIPNGSASKYFESVAEVINVQAIPQFDNTLYGNYRGFRWLPLLREINAYLKFTFSLIGKLVLLVIKLVMSRLGLISNFLGQELSLK